VFFLSIDFLPPCVAALLALEGWRLYPQRNGRTQIELARPMGSVFMSLDAYRFQFSAWARLLKADCLPASRVLLFGPEESI